MWLEKSFEDDKITTIRREALAGVKRVGGGLVLLMMLKILSWKVRGINNVNKYLCN